MAFYLFDGINQLLVDVCNARTRTWTGMLVSVKQLAKRKRKKSTWMWFLSLILQYPVNGHFRNRLIGGYLPYIFGLFERPKFQGFFPLNSYGLKYGTFHVLAYLHQLDLEIPIDPGDMCAVSIGSNWWRYVNVPYFRPYFVVIFPET